MHCYLPSATLEQAVNDLQVQVAPWALANRRPDKQERPFESNQSACNAKISGYKRPSFLASLSRRAGRLHFAFGFKF